MASLYDLTEREWHQCRAALKFWAEVAENSRVHPSRHTAIEPMLEKYGPLSVEEIESMLERLSPVQYVTKTDIAKAIKRSPLSVTKRIKKAGLQPDIVIGNQPGYRPERVGEIMPEIRDGLAAW